MAKSSPATAVVSGTDPRTGEVREFHRVRSIMLPTLSFKAREVVFIKALAKIRQASEQTKDGGKKMPAPHLMWVRSLEDGVEYNLICPTVMVSTFESFPDDYIGRCFEIRASNVPGSGKRYKEVEVYEVAENV